MQTRGQGLAIMQLGQNLDFLNITISMSEVS